MSVIRTLFQPNVAGASAETRLTQTVRDASHPIPSPPRCDARPASTKQVEQLHFARRVGKGRTRVGEFRCVPGVEAKAPVVVSTLVHELRPACSAADEGTPPPILSFASVKFW